MQVDVGAFIVSKIKEGGDSDAVMGYRLTDADVVACPLFPQVERTVKQLKIVDYAVIMGETGGGKSISLFQTGYRFVQKGWQVYQLVNLHELTIIHLPENTENSMSGVFGSPSSGQELKQRAPSKSTAIVLKFCILFIVTVPPSDSFFSSAGLLKDQRALPWDS